MTAYLNYEGASKYPYTEDISSGQNGQSVIVKPAQSKSGFVGVMVVAEGSPGVTGKVQYTFSSTANVLAGTANWVDWDDGDVTSNTGSTITAPVTAVRGVSVSGDIVFEVGV